MFKVTAASTGQAGMPSTLSSESDFRAEGVRAHPLTHPSPRCWCGVGVVAPTSRMHRSLLVTATLHDSSYVMTHKHSPLSSSEYQSPLHRTLPTPFYFVRSSAKNTLIS
ncbi:hypothetical protein CY34DRAFT_803132 [Suillus luteus UH-Slu-Lm8-n1]|uniref:Unplaced genomic scaffold CY34scaffold_68, whole genome shotgun sequence n=1 Tax=Suillus luteus UH-Slu-Lm8-n1 TaxID=930992 RepID=A0A0D0B1Y5_9AGAM|nr:hypothetical protein CY34DRAFT_803132 [Suillus luteus UH-Slu-Lm8-n1]